MCVRARASFAVVISIAGGLGRDGEGMNESSAETQGHLESLNQ